MKRIGIVLCALFCSTAFAKFSGELSVANDYVWRGQSWGPIVTTASNGRVAPSAVTSGRVQYDLDFGLGAAVVGRSHNSGYQNNYILHYKKTIGDFNLKARHVYKTYIRLPAINTHEWEVSGTWKAVYFELAYINNYFNTNTDNKYVAVGYTLPVDEFIKLYGQVGYSWFDDPKKVAHTNYFDYKIAFQHQKDDLMIELAFTATDRHRKDATTGDISDLVPDDKKTIASITKFF